MPVILPEPAPGFHWTSVSWGHVLKCDELDELVDHFFTARELHLRADSAKPAATASRTATTSTTMTATATGTTAATARADWVRVAAEIGVAPENLWRMRQVHGCAIATATSTTIVAASDSAAPEAPAPVPVPAWPEADGLLTIDPQVALAVQVADCVPLLLADRRTGAVAATHAGWRGAAANIAAATVQQLIERWNVRPHDLVAAIGPSIGPCCYQVGPDVKTAFFQGVAAATGATGATGATEVAGSARATEAVEETRERVETWFQPDTSDPRGDRLKLDMWKVNRDQLIAAGLLPEHVHVAGLCTASHVRHLYSYRVEGASTGRLLGVIRSRGARTAVMP